MSTRGSALVLLVAVIVLGACSKAPMTPATAGQATAVQLQSQADQIVAITKNMLSHPLRAQITRVADGQTQAGTMEWVPPNIMHVTIGNQDFILLAGTQKFWLKDPNGKYLPVDQAQVQGYLRLIAYTLPQFGMAFAESSQVTQAQAPTTENVNNVSTTVYKYTVTTSISGTSEQAQVTLWVDTSTGLPVKSQTVSPSNQTTITYTYDNNITITVPQG